MKRYGLKKGDRVRAVLKRPELGVSSVWTVIRENKKSLCIEQPYIEAGCLYPKSEIHKIQEIQSMAKVPSKNGSDGWVQLTGPQEEDAPLVKWGEPGQVVEGALVSMRYISIKGRQTLRVELRTDFVTDSRVCLLASGLLEKILINTEIPEGTMIRITHTGSRETSAGHQMRLFDVAVKS